MTKVKICANTNIEDVQLALSFGADYLGLIFAESKRRIDLEQAKTMVDSVKDFESFVGVFLNQPKEEVLHVAKSLNLKTLQFHGDETALYCKSFIDEGFEVIKTFHIKNSMSLKRIDDYNVSAFLLDTYSRTEKGGTGKTFDWSLLDDKAYLKDKLFLAGGLTVDNLEQAIDLVHPYAVDVASGIEKKPGKKDPVLLEAFIRIAKEGRKKNAAKSTFRK